MADVKRDTVTVLHACAKNIEATLIKTTPILIVLDLPYCLFLIETSAEVSCSSIFLSSLAREGVPFNLS